MTSTAGRADASEIARTFAELERVLVESAATVRRGDAVDLAGLEREVKTLLDATVMLPPTEARSLLPAMDRLLAALDGLEATLKDVHGPVMEKETASRRIRAAAAYRRPEEP